LKVAKDIAAGLESCKILSMSSIPHGLEAGASRIGFVFPVYGAGLPKQVTKFIESLDLSGNKDAYFFAVPTYGTVSGNSLAQIDKLLKAKEVRLDFGVALKMVHNNCANFNMQSKGVPKRNAEANAKIPGIVDQIKAKEKSEIPKEKFPFTRIHPIVMGRVAESDKNFNVSSDCAGCGTCERVCPADA
jgi:hypothetical protein